MTARSSWPHGVALSLVLGGTGLRAAAAEAPQVVASIKPIHSLVAGVMEGIGEPEYLVVGAGSEHGYSLRPSQAAALSQARVVFWVGENVETFLVKPLEALSGDAAVVALSTVDGVATLPTREGGMWEEHAAEHAGEHAEPSLRRGPRPWRGRHAHLAGPAQCRGDGRCHRHGAEGGGSGACRRPIRPMPPSVMGQR